MVSLRNYDNLFLFILIIPIINVVSSLATPFFPGILNPGIIRGILLSLFLGWYMLSKYKSSIITLPTILFSIYLFVLCWFSAEQSTSLYIYNKVVITSLMFVVGFQTFNQPDKFFWLLRVIMVSLFIMELYFLYSNFSGLGRKTYLDDSVLFGESGVNLTKAMVIFLLIVPIFLRVETNQRLKVIVLVLFFLGILIVFLGMKRSAILAMGFGFLIYVLLTPYKSRLIQFLPVVLIIVLVASPFYLPIIEKRFESRQQRVSMSYKQLQESETEGRMLEVQFTVEESLDAGIDRLLFGFDIFLKKDFKGHKRMLHVDYMNMLGGAGVIGLFFFVFIYFKIFQLANRIRKKLGNHIEVNEMFATLCALLGVQAFLSIGGTMQGVNLRGYILFLLGALLSVSIFYLQQQIEKHEVN
jgi:hypothetical protein